VGLSRNVSIVFEGIRTICQHAASWSESRSPRVVFHFASVNRSGEHRRRAVVSSGEQKHGKPNAIPKGLLDNPHAADVFADGATGWFYFNGNIRITFESVWCNHESAAGQVTRVVIGRLVMSLVSAEEMCRGLLSFIESQKGHQTSRAQATPMLEKVFLAARESFILPFGARALFGTFCRSTSF
jgi:hypothetical protein